MGTWGTGLYSNDIALDVRDMCNDVFAFFSVEEGNQIIFREYDEILTSEIIDNDYASFWYALTDYQWNHGILCDSIREKTLELLDAYAGMTEWEEVGNKKDIANRKKVLEKLKEKLRNMIY